MKGTVIKLGYCPTRRTMFSKEEAKRLRDNIKKIISIPEVEIIDIDDIHPEGLLVELDDVPKIIKKFKAADIDALFFPHCNFGQEGPVAEVARYFNLPTLIYGPRDDAPEADGMRTRDSQCGIFATSKVLRRFDVKFTYITSVHPEEQYFIDSFRKFINAANVVKVSKSLRVLQIGTRPTPFLSTITNENDLMEKFGAELFPVSVVEFGQEMDKIIREQPEDYKTLKEIIRSEYIIETGLDHENVLTKLAALKTALDRFKEKFRANCCAIQCWDALQSAAGCWPCSMNALFSEEGFPVACETDVNGAISARLLQAATGDKLPHFFADITVRHPEDDNVELLWHCGPFPPSFRKEGTTPHITEHWTGDSCLSGDFAFPLKNGDITVARFDGDHGKYSLLFGEGKGVDGPMTKGTYVWFKVKDWPYWEHKIVYGPYIHHIAGTYGNYADVLYEACRYIPALEADPVEPGREEIERNWR